MSFDRSDELFEAITLSQTEKIMHFPVVLYGSEYWGRMFDWIKGTMLKEEYISEKDLDLFHYADSPDEAANIIIYKALEQGFIKEDVLKEKRNHCR